MLCKLHCPEDANDVLMAAAWVAIVAVVVGVPLWWLLHLAPFWIAVYSVLSVACVAGAGVVVWEVRRNWGTLWKPPNLEIPAAEIKVSPVRVPAALPVRVPAAISGPRIVPGEVIPMEGRTAWSGK